MLLFFFIGLVCVLSYKEKEANQPMIVFLFFHPYYLYQTRKETFMTVKELFQLADFASISKKIAEDDWGLNHDKTKTEDEKREIKKVNSDYIYTCFLKMMHVIPIIDDQKIIVCSWHVNLDNPEDSYMDASLIHLDDLLTKEVPLKYDELNQESFSLDEYEKNYIQTYAFEFDTWEQILGYQVSSSSIQRYGIDAVSKAIFDEMTFFGYDREESEEKAQNEISIILERAEEIKSNPDACIPAEKVFSDLYQKYGFEVPTEEERAQRRKRIATEMKINQEELYSLLAEIKNEYLK